MNIHLKTILAMVTAFSVAMVPQSHAFAFGEVQVDEEYSVSLADSQTDTSYTKWLSSWNQTNYDSVTNVVLTPGSNLASLNFSWYAKTGTTPAVALSTKPDFSDARFFSGVSQKYETLKTQGNHNNNIGLPFTVLELEDEEAMVIEMGMNHFGEISVLTSIAKPTICVITNIGTSHIGNLGSRENILKAKLEILEGCKNPKVIINNDNDLLHKWYVENKEKYDIKTYGINEKSLFNAENIELQEQSSSFDCNIDGETKNITINVGGEHFILNALCAITVGKEMGISSDKIVKLTQKRMDIYDLKDNIKLINDAYNASFESMKASLKVLAEYKEHRKIAVLGDMFELGDFAKGLHENVGKEVAKNKIDILIASGENSKYIVEKAKEGLKSENIYYFEDKEKIEELLLKIVKPNDVILFKASNGMQFYKLAERMVEIWKK